MTTCGHCKTQRVSIEHVKMCSRLGTESLAKAASALGLQVEITPHDEREWLAARAAVEQKPARLADLPAEEAVGFYQRTLSGETDVFQVKVSKSSGKAYAELLSADAEIMDHVYIGRSPLYHLTLADRLTAEQAKTWADHNGHRCVFCGLTLTDERSTDAGYGPICAEKQGLPWG